MTLETRVDRLRKQIGFPLFIRGCTYEAKIERDVVHTNYMNRIPAYYVDPHYDMGARSWVELFRSTLYAASYRAIWKFLYKEISEQDRIWNYPVLAVFGPGDRLTPKKQRDILEVEHAGNEAEAERMYKEYFMNLRRSVSRDPSMISRKLSRSQREVYEWGSVFGRMVPTFIEADIHLSKSRFSDEWSVSNHMKMFEVEVSREEIDEIKRYVTLAFDEPAPEDKEGWQEFISKKRREDLGPKLEELYPYREFEGIAETSPRCWSPLVWSAYFEMSRLLVDRFMKTGLEFLNKYLPEEN